MSGTTARRLTLTVAISLFVYALACYSPISWSPEGKRIAFIQYAEAEKDKEKLVAELWVADVDSGQGERIAVGEAGLSAPAWSPDGGKIAYLCTDVEAVPEKPKKDTGLKAALVVYDLKSRSAQKVCDTFVPPEVEQGERILNTSRLQPSWSPDGKMIAFDCAEAPGKPKVMLSDLSGKTRALLESAAYPQWSPDGKWIACFSEAATVVGTKAHVAVVRNDGSDKRMTAVDIAKDANWTRIAWAPNSERVAYTSHLDTPPLKKKLHGIVLLTLDGKKTVLVTGDEDHELSFPVWSGDGKSIAFLRRANDGKGKPEGFSIVLCDVETKKEKVLSRIESKDQNEIASLSPAPQGNWLAYRWHGRIIKLLRSDGSGEKELAADPTSLVALLGLYGEMAEKAGDEESFSDSRKHAKKAVAYADEYLRRFPNTKWCGDVTGAKAKCLLVLNRPQEAADLLDSMSPAAPDPKAEQRAQCELAECHVALGQYSDALVIWRGLVELHGDTDADKRSKELAQAIEKAQSLASQLSKRKTAADYLALAQIYYRTLLDPKKATDALQAILKEFPNSKEAAEAKELLKKVEEKFAKE